MELRDLGSRICVMGQSGSGKSTLAEAIGRKESLPVVHLDQCRHLPGTRFEERPDEEFRAMHATAIAGDRWVVDGNYSQLVPPRLARATGLILLNVSTRRSFARYVIRTMRSDKRIGGLGVQERLSLPMIRFIVFRSAANRARRLELFHAAELPKVLLDGAGEIERFWTREGLTRRPKA
jgi:adenylate kinase family enzyme